MKAPLKLLALQAIYAFHEELLGRWAVACRQGCSTCCTQSVTMTGLEGEYLLAYLQRQQKMDILERIARPPAVGRPQLTTNQLAAACLEGRETEQVAAGWNLTPCPFLAKHSCMLYQARPFGCRALVSLGSCAAAGAAETPPLLLSVNIMVMQVIEHLDQGGRWGNMLEVLACLTGSPERQEGAMPFRLLLNQPCPGFLVAPEEEAEICRLQEKLFAMPMPGGSLGDLLGVARN
jgi:Fe-S-cluster containining protein